eukprot:Colp12_sorted_trinity150504_noHs@14042
MVKEFSSVGLTQEEIVALEDQRSAEEIAELKQWFASPRFEGKVRRYKAEDVYALRGTAKQSYFSDVQAKKMWKLLCEHRENGTTAHTFGALDPIQVVQMAKYISTVYISGWQCSSTASTSNEPGPDLADYPMYSAHV